MFTVRALFQLPSFRHACKLGRRPAPKQLACRSAGASCRTALRHVARHEKPPLTRSGVGWVEAADGASTSGLGSDFEPPEKSLAL